MNLQDTRPVATHGSQTGALLPGIQDVVQQQQKDTSSARSSESFFNEKQSTMHDTSRSTAHLFEHVRPSMVSDEGETENTFAPEVVLEQAMDNVLDLSVRMSNVLENQFISKYLPRICPWAFNYD